MLSENTLDEAVDFVFHNYSQSVPFFNKEDLKKLILSNENKVVIVKDGNRIAGVGFYYKLDNVTFKRIVNRDLDIGLTVTAYICLSQKGSNIHFILVVAKSMVNILKGLREVIKRENPKTISWFSPDMNKIFIRRRILCHQ